jgi:hypothetical protein
MRLGSEPCQFFFQNLLKIPHPSNEMQATGECSPPRTFSQLFSVSSALSFWSSVKLAGAGSHARAKGAAKTAVDVDFSFSSPLEGKRKNVAQTIFA